MDKPGIVHLGKFLFGLAIGALIVSVVFREPELATNVFIGNALGAIGFFLCCVELPE